MSSHVKNVNDSFKKAYKGLAMFAASPVLLPFICTSSSTTSDNLAGAIVEESINSIPGLLICAVAWPVIIPATIATTAIAAGLALITSIFHLVSLAGASIADAVSPNSEEEQTLVCP